MSDSETTVSNQYQKSLEGIRAGSSRLAPAPERNDQPKAVSLTAEEITKTMLKELNELMGILRERINRNGEQRDILSMTISADSTLLDALGNNMQSAESALKEIASIRDRSSAPIATQEHRTGSGKW